MAAKTFPSESHQIDCKLYEYSSRVEQYNNKINTIYFYCYLLMAYTLTCTQPSTLHWI